MYLVIVPKIRLERKSLCNEKDPECDKATHTGPKKTTLEDAGA